MSERVLVTGGAGFIGSHIVDGLLERGHQVRVFDSLEPQVHGEGAGAPAYLSPDVEFVKGDVRDREAVTKAIADIDVVFHEAAAVGVGQSMYEIARYVSYNTYGGAVLLDVLVNEKNTVRKLLVASSMSIYGEGAYRCPTCGDVYPKLRGTEQLRKREWEMKCPKCGQTAEARPTDEDKPLYPTSIYATTKRDHEEMFLQVGLAYNIPTVALRYFNVYGPRQALSNPYTGVAAIFSARLLSQNPPVIYEDGLQSRDFVHISDVVQANMLAMEKDEANYNVFNVGTGSGTAIVEVARVLGKRLAPGVEPKIAGQFRAGDIRHCFADISKIQAKLGYKPKVQFEDGVEDLLSWVAEQPAVDNFELASRQLENRGLTM